MGHLFAHAMHVGALGALIGLAACGDSASPTVPAVTATVTASAPRQRMPDSLADRLSQSYRVEELAELRRMRHAKSVGELAPLISSAQDKAAAAGRMVRAMELALSYKYVAVAAREQRLQIYTALAVDKTQTLKVPREMESKNLDDERKALAAARDQEIKAIADEEVTLEEARKMLAAVKKEADSPRAGGVSPYVSDQKRASQLLSMCADAARAADCNSGVVAWQYTAERLAAVLGAMERER